jgi:RNase P/RNase MRP subunit p29
MRWPDIFFKAKKPRPEPGGPPPLIPAPETPQPAATGPPPQPQPPTIKPVPAALGPKTTMAIALPQEKRDASPAGTHTLPAMHGVVLRPPTWLSTTTNTLPTAAAVTGTGRATAPLKNIEQLMAEADPVSTLNQTGSIRLLKKIGAETAPLKPAVDKPAEPSPAKPATPVAATPIPKPVAVIPPSAPWDPPPFPAFKPAGAAVSGEVKKATAAPVAKAPSSLPEPTAPPTANAPSPVPPTVSAPAPAPAEDDSPFILKPAATPASTPKVIPPPPPPALKPISLPIGSIFRRKAKMTDLAKIVLPPKREDTQPLHPPGAASPTVVPPAFPVAAMTARATQVLPKARSSALSESAPITKVAKQEKELEPIAAVETDEKADSGKKTEIPEAEKLPEVVKEPEKSASSDAAPAPAPAVEPKPPAPAPDLHLEPKVDPEAHKPEPTATPQIDPEAHKPTPPPAPAAATTALSTPTAPPEKREFHLANGERVAGVVLSETPEAIYLEHGTLGVITIPRAQIAKRLVEIILINGDRIVGDIMAETADTLYVRHASLGMLTVPRAQRSTRVVEAILKDGDRILGEVLTETDTFTVIRSATLGTITVPHDKVSMLNRKIEQIELKSLPPPAPELKDKPA